MKVHYLERTQRLPIAPDVAWAFFANPASLAQLTPPWMQFSDETFDPAKRVYAGMILNFRLRLFGWIPLRWLGEITHVEEGKYFVDIQHSGPFAFWHHAHHIVPVPGEEAAVDIVDRIHYAMPVGVFGTMGHGMIGRKLLQSMMDHRRRMLEEFFGGDTP